jgi:uncharacterized RDD family membrane protein YckC
MAFSSDGNRFATANLDETIMLWDMQNPSIRGVPLEGHTGSVRSMAFSSDGNRLATGHYYGTFIMLWDLQDLSIPGVPLKGHTSRVADMAFSSDGNRLATATYDGTIMLWDLQHLSIPGVPLKGHTNSVADMAFSSDGNRFAYIGERSWDRVDDDKQPNYLTGGGASVYASMVAVAKDQESTIFAKAINASKDFFGVFLLFLVLPLLKLIRWWQRRRGVPFPVKPNALVRVIASLIDLAIGLGIFFLAFTLTYNSFEEGTMAWVVGTLSALTYLLFSDAIRFKYCRSIGKILCDLRLVNDVAENHHSIGLVASAKRNTVFIIETVVILIGSYYLIFFFELYRHLTDILYLPGWVFIPLAAYWLSIIFMRGRTLGDRWSHTQVIDADSEESRRMDVPQRYIRTDPGQA